MGVFVASWLLGGRGRRQDRRRYRRRCGREWADQAEGGTVPLEGEDGEWESSSHHGSWVGGAGGKTAGVIGAGVEESGRIRRRAGRSPLRARTANGSLRRIMAPGWA